MKTHFSIAVLLVAIAIAACDQAPKRAKSDDINKQNEKPSAVKSYRFKSLVEKCDTYQRRFETQLELCYAIQIDELNNNCAETERLAFFAQNCSKLNIPVSAEQARQLILNVDGDSVDCTLQEQGLPKLRQYTGSPKMIMEHTATRAVIMHSTSMGKTTLKMALYSVSSNQLISQTQKVWQDEAAETLTLSAPTSLGSPILTCLVSDAQDPTRE